MTATDTALAALDAFLQQWLGPSAFRHMLDCCT
jgi:hypothetical protein